MIQIKKGKILVQGIETKDPTLIELAFLDVVEKFNKSRTKNELVEKFINNFNSDCLELGFEEKIIGN